MSYFQVLVLLGARAPCVRAHQGKLLRDHAMLYSIDTLSSNRFLWYDMQTAIDALEKLLEEAPEEAALKHPDVFPIWGLVFGFIKLLVNKDLSAARKDKHLQYAIAYLMVKVASVANATASNLAGKATAQAKVPADVPAHVQTAIAKIVRKHWQPFKVEQLIKVEQLVEDEQLNKVKPRIADVDALFKLVGWNDASPTYARCNRTHMFDGVLCDN